MRKKIYLLLALCLTLTFVKGQQTPWGGTANPIPGKLEAEYYDEGVGGYFDIDGKRGNQNFAERAADTMEFEVGTDYVALSYTNDGDWIEFTSDVAKTGVYTVVAKYSVIDKPAWKGNLKISSDEVVLDSFFTVHTTAWTNYVPHAMGFVSLSSGQQEIRATMQCLPGMWNFFANLDWIEFREAASLTAVTVGGTPLAGFKPEKTDYIIDVPAGAVPTLVATPITGAVTSIVDPAVLPGTATVTVTGAALDTMVYTIVYNVPEMDASLSEIKVITGDTNDLVGFDPEVTLYTIYMDDSATVVPTIIAKTNYVGANAVVTPAAQEGDTVVIAVTAADNVTKMDYKIVVDRQKHYGPAPQIVPGIVEAENYDIGGEGIAFHDDASKSGDNNWRPGDNVDVAVKAAQTEVGWTAKGEWLEYTVDVKKTADYVLIGRFAVYKDNGPIVKLSVDHDSINIYGPPLTGDWGVYKIDTLDTINLIAGKRLLQIKFAEDTNVQINFDYLKLVNPTASKDTTLSTLTLDGTEISGFDPQKFTYEVEIETGGAPVIAATANDVNSLDLQIQQAPGVPGTGKVIILAEDGFTSATYTVNFVRPKSTDATLTWIKVNGQNVSNFDAATYTYNEEIGASVTSVTVTAQTADAGATYMVTKPASGLEGDYVVEVTAEDTTAAKKTYTVKITQKITGVELVSVQELSVYPNPTDGNVHLVAETPMSEIRVLSVAGSVVKQLTDVNVSELSLDISDLQKGAYIIMATSLDKVYTGTVLLK